MPQPKVSVLMSVYNGEDYLHQAVNSILNQTLSDFEFIIVDDASTDRTPQLLKDFRDQDQRIRLIHNKKNLGLTSSLNKAILESKGEYVARQDVDDVSLPQRLASQVHYLDRNDKIGVVGTWVIYIDQQGNQKGIWQPHTSPEIVKWSLFFHNPIAHPSVILRRSLIKENDVYNPELKFSQDYDLWVRLSEKTKLANLPRVLIFRRLHKGMITAKYSRQQCLVHIKILEKLINKIFRLNVPRELVENFYFASQGRLQETKEKFLAVVSFIEDLYRSYISKNLLEDFNRRQIKEDVGYRIVKLAIKHLSYYPQNACFAMLHSFRYNWHFIPRSYFKKAIRRRMFKIRG